MQKMPTLIFLTSDLLFLFFLEYGYVMYYTIPNEYFGIM